MTKICCWDDYYTEFYKTEKEKESKRDSWDSYFMNLAIETSKRSKDPNTKVGACIVKDKKVLSLGYNGAPRNFDDSLVPMNNNSQNIFKQKNTYMCHAELNAIINYNGSLLDLEGSTLYVTIFPCHECAKIIAQLGIKNIIYKDDYHRQKICDVSKYILETCGVSFTKFLD